MTEIDQIPELDRMWAHLLEGREKHLCLPGLWGASRALVMALLQGTRPHPLLMVTATPSEADRLYKDLAFFLHGQSGRDIPGLALFPQWEILPFDDKSPHPEITRQRLSTLHRLLQGERLITITTIRALSQKVLPRESIMRGCFDFKIGGTLHLDQLSEALLQCGYERTDLVEQPGTFCIRGGIFDLYPSNLDYPIRIDLLGDEIESIRRFSPHDQRSTDEMPRVETTLTRELLFDPEARLHYRRVTEGDPHPLAETLEDGTLEGIEFYAPLFSPSMETLFDFLLDDTVVVLDQPDEVRKHGDAFWKEIAERHELAYHQERGPCSISALYLSPDELKDETEKRRLITFALVPEEGATEYRFKTESIGGLSKPGKSRITALGEMLRETRDLTQFLIVVRTKGQADRLTEVLSGEEEIPCARYDNFGSLKFRKGVVSILIGRISAGFRFPLLGLTLITEEEIFGISRTHRHARAAKEKPFLTKLTDLKEGDYVVHVDHGIGLYRGLREVEVEGLLRDLIRIEYTGKDMLYVPPEKIHLLQKYSGSDSQKIQLNRLGGTGWEKLKSKVRKSIEEMSRDLIELYAMRKMAKGFAYTPPDNLFREFEETFEYEETPDQERAIRDVLRDMQKAGPMDRLVCGDVGYGKTEVAMRAAFKAALDGKQAAILVPTTLLAQQHFDTFTGRFSAFPVQVEALSRFKTRGEQKKIVEAIQKGEVDILIGTHRLLSRDIAFKDLGLVIIDEEQRFGVRHKEKLKQLRREVDVLTLSATPIPRTLEMSFLGIRDISIINTPPEDRLSIYTRVARFSEGIIREAVLRELDRSGQIFFVHNQVRDIDRIAGMVQRIVPEARVDVVHGQMEKRKLQRVMDRFLDKEIDLLVTTTIIESGLDIPNANTMIIHRPEAFGLGQLYQLRGRIGRTQHRAYAYLLTRSDRAMTAEARQRLQVIQELTELGSGFQLAARDLEIRGAGNLLGAQQSGFLAAVGFDLYLQIVEEVSLKLKGEEREERVEPAIHMKVAARIPKQYVREDRLRLDLYRRLALIDYDADLLRIADEMRDRFGAPPVEVENLFRIVELNLLCRRLRVLEVLEKQDKIRLTFDATTPVRQETIVGLMQSNPGGIRPLSEYQIELVKEKETFSGNWAQTKNFLQELV
jgi:transcription-repair coupling factor (superfamily II helicase)